MTVLIVDLIGVALIGLIVWYFWLSKPQGSLAAAGASGTQEAFIVVKGGYSPDTIRVEAGKPVKLVFNRQEADPCSEKVVFDSFGVSADLPEGENIPVEFTPAEPGEYEFACQMGMLRGKLVVT
jgi:plastocyanin domain-containing protein